MPKEPTGLLFDSDVLLKLAQHPANMNAIAAVAKAVKDCEYSLIVPEPVHNAFIREATAAPERYWKSRRTSLQHMKSLADLSPDPTDFQKHLDALESSLDKFQSTVPATVKAVEDLLATGTPVRTTDLHLATAARWAQQERAPAQHYKKSSLNDCVIWQVALARLDSIDLIFCTDNYTDFSDPKHRKKLHPTLAGEAAIKPNNICYHDLQGFHDSHIKQVTIIAPPSYPQWGSFHICPACGSELAPDLIPRPSGYGGWSYQQYCSSCGKYIDTGEPYDE